MSSPNKTVAKQSVPEIPVDLYPSIASHIADAQTLRALSLTSRTWAAPAQRYIFARLTILGDLDNTPPGRRNEDMIAFFDGAPHLAPYITHLIAVERDGDGPIPRTAWEAVLCALLPRFPRLARVALTWTGHARWQWAAPPYATPRLAQILDATLRNPRVRHVELTNAPVSWLAQMTPHVEHIALFNSYIDAPPGPGVADRRGEAESDSDSAPAPASAPALPYAHVRPTALLIDGPSWAASASVGEAVRCVLEGGLDVSRVRKLGLGLVSAPLEAHQHAAGLLQACASTLRELSLSPAFKAYSVHRDAYTDRINLGVLPHLRVLHLSMQAGIIGDAMDVDPALWLLAQLKRMPNANALRTVVLSTKYTVYETVANNGYWGASFHSIGLLEILLLAKKQFPRFRMFTTYVEDMEEAPKYPMVLWIAKSMARFTRRFAERGAFAFKHGSQYRPTMFPPDSAW